MLRIPAIDLPEPARLQLQNWQAEIDAESAYEQRVALAKQRFSSHNTAANQTFRQVKATLGSVRPGVDRCHYCEHSSADEVEHIRPKNFYPEAVFAWENYLYACGPCNGGKRDQFAVISDKTGEIVYLIRKHGEPITPPEAGQMLLINPRQEDPLTFMRLDLLGTFTLRPRSAVATLDYERANYTIKLLDLNADNFLRARANAYKNYFNTLRVYIDEAQHSNLPDRFEQLKTDLRNMDHPTVWKEMQRSHHFIDKLRELFEQAPEALEL